MRWKGGKMRIQNVMATSIKIDTVSATQSLRSMNTALKASTNAWKAEEVQAKSVGDYLKASQAKYEGLGRSIDQVKEKIKLIQERQKALDLTTEDGKNSYNRYAKQLGVAVKQLSSMTAQQERAKSAMKYQTSGLASLQSRYRSLNEVNSSYVKRLEAEGKKYEAAKTRLASYKSAVENLTKQQKIQESELSRIASESGKASSAYHAQEVKVNQTATSISKLNSKVKSAQSEVNKLNPNGFNKIANGAKHVTNAADKMKAGLKGAWEHVKTGATAAAAGIGAVGAAAVSGAKKAGDLEQSYREITNLAVTGGEKQKEAVENVTKMQKQGRDMSIQYGKSQQSIAEAFEELVKRGYSTKQALGAMRTELQGSVASGDDFKDVVSVSSTTLESFGMRAKSVSQMTRNTKRAVNELAYAADMTSTGFKDLGYGMSYVGSSAHQAGFSLSETASAMGILSNNGLEASKAGTGLNQVINRLSDATGKLLKGDNKNALAKLGITPREITTSTGQLKSLSTVFGVLNKHMQGMSKVQKINIMKSLFGMTGEQAGLILAKYNKQLGDLSKGTLKAGKDGQYVANLASKNSQTAKMQMARLKEAGEAFTMTLGAKMLPAINKAGDELVVFLTKSKDGKKLTKDFANGVEALSNGLVKMIEWIAHHQTETKLIATGLGAAYGVVKLANMVQWLNETRLALKGLNVSKHLLDISDKTAIKWVNLKDKVTSLGKTLKNSRLANLATKAGKDIVTGFKKGAVGIGKAGKWLGSKLLSGSKALISKATELGRKIGGAISKAVKATTKFSMGKRLATGAVAGAAVAAPEVINAVKDRHSADKRSQDIGGAVGALAGGTLTSMIPVVGPMLAPVGAIIGKYAGRWGGQAVNNFTKGWQKNKPPKKFWSLENLGWSTHDMFNKIGKWGGQVGKKFGRSLNKGKSWVKKNSKELALTAVNPIAGIPTLLYKNNPKFRKWANGVAKNIKGGLNKAKKSITGFKNSVNKNFKKAWDSAYKHASKGTKQIMRSTEKFAKNYVKTNKKANSETVKNFGSFSKRLKKNHGDLFKTIGQTAKKQLAIEKKRWSSNWKNIKTTAQGIWKGLNRNASDMYKKLNSKTHGGLGKVLTKFKAFGKSVGDFWNNLWKGVRDTFDRTIKGLKDAAGNVGKFFTGKLKVGNIHLADGTDWKKKYGYPAIVNDGSDSPETNNREGLIDTDGTLKIFPNVRNLKWWMLPGQHVVNAHDLATMFGSGVHLASGTLDFDLLKNYKIGDVKTPNLLSKLVKINSQSLKLKLKTYAEDKERHEKTKRRREKKDRKAKRTTRTRKGMEYLDSSFFTGGKSTGKIVSVSKSWLKKYLESKLPKRSRKRTRTTRHKSSSSRSSSRSRNTTTTRRERTSVSASVSGLSSVRSLAAAIKAVSGSHTAKITVSASNTKSVKSLKSALSKVKSKRIKVSVSGTKSVKSLSSALKGISKKGTLKGISSASSRLKTLSKRTKSTRSSLKGLSSANSKASKTNKTLANQLSKTSSKVKSLYKAAKKNKFGKEIKSQAEEAVKSLKGKGNFAKTFESMTKKFGKDLKSMSKVSTKEFKSMWSNIEKTSKSGENSTHKSFNTFSSSYKRGWKSLESGVSATFDHFWTTMRKTAGKGLNKVIDVLNSGIGKINTVISNFGGNKNAVHKVGGVHYATGTGYFAGRRPITRPTWTILNDGNDSPETQNREGIYNKQTGELTVVSGRNVPKLLDSRHEVFSASEMRDLGFTHYASGTGYLKRLYDQAKHYWNNPTKTGDSLFGKITGLVGAINSLANGMLKDGKKHGTEWWSQLWKMVEDKVEDGGDATLTGLVKAMAKNGHGKIYQWGATGPKEFDCSGLVMYTLKKDFGIDYPHFSGNQYSVSQHISRSEAKPGDLVFWGRNGGIHVGAYAGHNQYYSAYGPNGTHGIGMMPLSSVVGYGKPLFARVRGLKQKDDKHEEVKANTKLQKLIKNQVGKGFWKTISKIADKFGDAGGAGNVKLTGDLTQKSLQLAKALKRADPKATAKGIAALISNAIAESTLNAGVTNGSGATGLWQFLGSRRVGLENYARRHGGSYHNAGIQIDYALHGDSSRALFKELLEGSRSPYSMAYQFSRQWEIGGNDAGHAAHADSLYKLLKDHGYANGGIISSPQLAMVGEGNGPETIVPWDITKRARAYRLMDRTLKHFKQQDAPTNQGEDSKILLEILKVMTSIEKKLDSEITETRRLGEQPINVSGDFNVDGRKFARYIRTYLREFDRQTVVRGRYNLSDR